MPASAPPAPTGPPPGADRRAVVLGGGIAGVTTAYFLARDGFRVSVVERLPAAALGTSHANGGFLGPGLLSPAFASHASLRLAAQDLGRRLLGTGKAVAESGALPSVPLMVMRRSVFFERAFYTWNFHYLHRCFGSIEAAQARSELLRNLNVLNRAVLEQVVGCEDAALAPFEIRRGVLQLYGSDEQAAFSEDSRSALEDTPELQAEVCSPARAAEIEPLLAGKTGLAGAIYLPHAATGDCRLFVERLSEVCSTRYNVDFHYDTEVRSLALGDNDACVGVVVQPRGEASTTVLKADVVVVCLGYESRGVLAAAAGIDFPIVPMKGYSITGTLPADTPRQQVGLILRHVYMSPFSDGRFRLAGIAEFSGSDMSPKPRVVDALVALGDALFDGAASSDDAVVWTGGRPQTADDVPAVGPVPGRPGLYANFGHGRQGWMTGLATAQILCDLVAGRNPALPVELMRVDRFA